MNVISYDPLMSFARLLEDFAKRVETWQLRDPSEEQNGHRRCAAMHIRLGIKHLYRAEGRKPPEPDIRALVNAGYIQVSRK